MKRSSSSAGCPPNPDVVAETQRSLVTWYSEHGRTFPWRDAEASQYERIVAEFLLQRTRATTVAIYLPRVLEEASDWRQLAQLPQDRLESALRPMGLWRNRARTLHALAEEMVQRRGRVPKTLTAVLQLPGAGQYLARAMLLIAHGTPGALLDTNMDRMLERHFGPRKLSDIRDDPWLQKVAAALTTCERSLDVNYAILDLAAVVCKSSKPTCRVCPISRGCLYCETENLLSG